MTDHSLSVVVLAAGAGTRMKSAVPKVLHPLAGKPLIAHVLDTSAELEPASTVVVLRHQLERVADELKARRYAVSVVEQDDVPGTGRAAELGASALPTGYAGDVLIVSGDVPLLTADALKTFIDGYRASGSAAGVLTAELPDPTGFGRIVRDVDGEVAGIVEHGDATDAQREIHEINSGTYLFKVPALLAALEQVDTKNMQGEKYLTDVIALLREHGEGVYGYAVEDPWLVAGVNDRAQLSDVTLELNRRIVRQWQRDGVTIQDPASTFIDLDVTIAQDVTILPDTQLKGATVIHPFAEVGPGTTLVDCEVGSGATVNRVQATSARIGAGANIGPFTYLRPGSVIGPDGKVGAFCEMKNATIGRGTKVPHLSYVGDAEVGDDTNIGAGTIFANYDGINKHHSKVGSNARTGAHNVFVAPVTIGDGVYTAAGTVVRKDIAPGDLARSYAPQQSLEGWVLEHRKGSAAAEAAETAQRSAESNNTASNNAAPDNS